jgi:hypothetical protein
MASLSGSSYKRPRSIFGGSWLAVLGLVFLIAGCATGPQYPLYSPLAVTGTFGYTEQRINDATYRVTYMTPARTAYSPYANPEPHRTALLNLANDMALMRAAELALANGHKTFRVTQRDNDVDVRRERYDRFCDDPFWPRRPYYYPPSYYRCGPDGYTHFQARSTLTVEFGNKPGDEHYVAEDVLARLQQTYPTARAVGSAKQ